MLSIYFFLGRYTTRIHPYIRSIGIILQVPQDSTGPARKRLISCIDDMELNYDIIILLQHILYLYYIYDDIVK
jgi:hypothetical protein